MAFPHRAARPSKRLGQNFLIDQSIAAEIVSSVAPSRADTVLEPGPGHGTLTTLLKETAGRVIAIEKDPILVRELQTRFSDDQNVTILEGDILKMKESIPSFNKLVSTPPYYISSKLTLLLAEKKFDVAAVVFQKEFGNRLLAEPGTSDYGRLTVAAQRKLRIERLRDVSRRAFSPQPKVESSLLKFRHKEAVTELDEPLFDELVRGLFTQRRRVVKGALRHFLRKKYGEETGAKLVGRVSIPELRVFQLSVEDLENLSLQVWRVISDATSSGVLKL